MSQKQSTSNNDKIQNSEKEEQPKLKGAKGILHMLFVRKWHPQPTVNTTIIIFAVVGVLFLILGIMILIFNSMIIEKTLDNYQDEENCVPIDGQANQCVYEFKIPSGEHMNEPIYMFYSLDNFYQNHRRYMKSKNSNQLSGEVISKSDAESCSPVVKNKDLDFGDKLLVGGQPISDFPDEIASPCGLIAKSYFNDSYELYEDETMTDNNRITINDKNIAWPEDKDNKYKAPEKQADKDMQWIDPSNEHFIVWMRTSGLPNFRKLWGKVEQKLEEGKTYYLKINNVYDVEAFAGSKGIVFSTSGPLGGKNPFLAVAFLVVGIVCIIIAIIFLFKKNLTRGAFGETNKQQKSQ